MSDCFTHLGKILARLSLEWVGTGIAIRRLPANAGLGLKKSRCSLLSFSWKKFLRQLRLRATKEKPWKQKKWVCRTKRVSRR